MTTKSPLKPWFSCSLNQTGISCVLISHKHTGESAGWGDHRKMGQPHTGGMLGKQEVRALETPQWSHRRPDPHPLLLTQQGKGWYQFPLFCGQLLFAFDPHLLTQKTGQKWTLCCLLGMSKRSGTEDPGFQPKEDLGVECSSSVPKAEESAER